MFNYTEMDDIAYPTTKYDRLEWNNFLSFFSDEVEAAKSALPDSFQKDPGFHYEMNVLSREVFSRMFGSSDRKLMKSKMRHFDEIHSALSGLHEFQNAQMNIRGKWHLAGAFTLGFMTTMSHTLDFDRCDEIAIEDGEEFEYQSKMKPHSDVQMRTILRRAIADGEETAEIWKELVGLSCLAGDNPDEPQKMNDVRKMLGGRNRDKLKKIAKAIGRLRHVMNAATTKRAVFAKSEVYGVKLGKEFQNLTSSEFGKMACGGIMAAEVIGRVISGNALQMAHRGKQKEGMGPILVYIDGSGSMSDPFRGATRAEWACAIGVVLSLVAKKQNREFYAAPFSTVVHANRAFKTGDGTDKMMELLEYNPRGGTYFLPCAYHATQKLSEKEFKKADVVMVTDGVAGDYCKASFGELKKKGARIHLIKIDGSYKTDIDSISDTVTEAVNGDNDNDMEDLFASVMKEK